YLSALTELGLVLMLVTVVVNALARLLIWRMSRPRRTRSFLSRRVPLKARADHAATDAAGPGAAPCPFVGLSRKAYWADRLMTGVLGLCLLLTTLPLFLILGYLVSRGAGALAWDFFTKLPAPVGPKGGG